jgi:hypothetical protein
MSARVRPCRSAFYAKLTKEAHSGRKWAKSIDAEEYIQISQQSKAT